MTTRAVTRSYKLCTLGLGWFGMLRGSWFENLNAVMTERCTEDLKELESSRKTLFWTIVDEDCLLQYLPISTNSCCKQAYVLMAKCTAMLRSKRR
jgi:hypothetical protein